MRRWSAATPAGPAGLVGLLCVGLLAVGCAPAEGAQGSPAADAGGAVEETPRFEVDPHWPKPLPNNWILGQVSGVAVDGRDHVWIVHRPTTVNPVNAGAAQDPPIAMCCVPAPPVLEFDPEGNVVGAWGDAEQGYEWPEEAHGIFVDHRDRVWVGGGHASPATSGHYVLAFTRQGEFLLQVGDRAETGGSGDRRLLGGPTAMHVDPEDDELYIADGYQNRRVIVFDASTGEYRRHWGAYGNAPRDDASPARDYGPGEDAQFRGPVHGVRVSRDGYVYAADRSANRVQVFRKDGEFVDEIFIRPETLSMGTPWDLALSTDPEERWLFVPDGTNNTVWIVDRRDHEVVGNFGRGGRMAGEFDWIHNVAVDSRGNLFTAEVNEGNRVQKFRPVR